MTETLPQGSKVKITIEGTIGEKGSGHHNTHWVNHADGHHSFVYLGGDDEARMPGTRYGENSSVTVELLEPVLKAGYLYRDTDGDKVIRTDDDRWYHVSAETTHADGWVSRPLMQLWPKP